MDRAAALVEALASLGTQPVLGPLEWHGEIGSTSDRVKDLARGGAPEWTVVAADHQTSGRGRGGRTWASPPGGLYLSVLLRPRAVPLTLLPLAAGVAVAEAVASLGVAVELKWPNDVLASGRKLAGILAESSSSGGAVDWVALDPGGVPELAERATSLRALGASVEPVAVAARVLARLVVWYDALRGEPSRVAAAWREHAAPWWGSEGEVTTHGGERVLRGRLRAVDDAGALVIELPQGETRHLVSGEVQRLRRAAP